MLPVTADLSLAHNLELFALARVLQQQQLLLLLLLLGSQILLIAVEELLI